MTDNELLLAISDIMDKKIKSELQAELQPLKDDMKSMKEEQKRVRMIIENEIRPDIKLLSENYLPAAVSDQFFSISDLTEPSKIYKITTRV